VVGLPTGKAPDTTVSGRSFRLIWAAHTLSVIGDGLVVVVLPLMVLQMTGSATLAALAAAPTTLAYGLLGLVAGPLVDRWPSRTVLVVSDGTRAALFAAVTALALAGTAGPWPLLLLALLAACAGVLFETAHVVYVRQLLADDQFVAANARLEGVGQVGTIVGPILAGLVTTGFGTSACLLLNAASFAVSMLLLLLVRQPPAEASVVALTVRALRADLVEGLRHLGSHAVVRRITLLQLGVNLAVAVETLMIFFATAVIGGGPLAASVVVAAAALGGVAGAAAAAPIGRRSSAEPTIAWSVVALAVFLAGASIAANLVWLALANAGIGAASVLATVNIRALRQLAVPQQMLARVTSAARTLAVAAYPVGVLLAGLLTDLRGADPRPAFGIAALLMAASGVNALRRCRPERQQEG